MTEDQKHEELLYLMEEAYGLRPFTAGDLYRRIAADARLKAALPGYLLWAHERDVISFSKVLARMANTPYGAERIRLERYPYKARNRLHWTVERD